MWLYLFAACAPFCRWSWRRLLRCRRRLSNLLINRWPPVVIVMPVSVAATTAVSPVSSTTAVSTVTASSTTTPIVAFAATALAVVTANLHGVGVGLIVALALEVDLAREEGRLREAIG